MARALGVPATGLIDCPSLALYLIFKVWASTSLMVKLVHRQRLMMRWPTSSHVAVNPDEAAVPPTMITFDCPLGSVDPVKAVPTVTPLMVISPTGVVPKSTLRVLSESLYEVGMSLGAE
jgi:hypothetical protein